MALEAERDVRLQQEAKQQVNTLFMILIGYEPPHDITAAWDFAIRNLCPGKF